MSSAEGERLPAIVAIVGPTASGKSGAAVAVAKRLGGEIVSADSMQIYRGFDIGTAKPTAEERGGVAHHMIDVADPREPWSAPKYRNEAMGAIEGIRGRGKRPILCGGSGLYLEALMRPLGFASHRGDPEARAELESMLNEPIGPQQLRAMLDAIDPESAARIPIGDARRTIRAIEVYRATGKTMTECRKEDSRKAGGIRTIRFGIAWDRAKLYARIEARVEDMMRRGWVEETRRLSEAGAFRTGTAVQALGYSEILRALRGEQAVPDAVDAIKRKTRNYAKRQLTWFRRDGEIEWIDADAMTPDRIAETIIERIIRHDAGRCD